MSILKREMGYTRVEFLRNLDSALRGYGYKVDDSLITISLPASHVVAEPMESIEPDIVITVGQDQLRRIASIAIPFITVDFDFSRISEKDRVVFLKQFDLYYQKGGG